MQIFSTDVLPSINIQIYPELFKYFMTSAKSRMFKSRYGVIGSVNAVCNYPMDVKSINCITILEDYINKDLRMFLLDECKAIFSKGKVHEMDKLKKSQTRLFSLIGIFSLCLSVENDCKIMLKESAKIFGF